MSAIVTNSRYQPQLRRRISIDLPQQDINASAALCPRQSAALVRPGLVRVRFHLSRPIEQSNLENHQQCQHRHVHVHQRSPNADRSDEQQSNHRSDRHYLRNVRVMRRSETVPEHQCSFRHSIVNHCAIICRLRTFESQLFLPTVLHSTQSVRDLCQESQQSLPPFANTVRRRNAVLQRESSDCLPQFIGELHQRPTSTLQNTIRFRRTFTSE